MADHRTIGFRPGAVEVDVSTFEALLTRATRKARVDAVALYRGPLLEGLRVDEEPFDEWLRAERERLRALALTTLEELLEHPPTTGSRASLELALRLVAIDPLRESGHRWLMRFYAEHGQASAALRQYEVCATALRRELRVLPEPETRRLYQDILQRGQRLSAHHDHDRAARVRHAARRPRRGDEMLARGARSRGEWIGADRGRHR